MSEKKSDFGAVSGRFNEHYGQVRGFVREQVVRRNLDDTLRLSSGRPKRILDLEARAGRDASWLSGLGHDLTIVESSPEQLKVISGQPGLEGVEILYGDINTAISHYQVRPFDLVLSHGVLLYQHNPEEYFKKLHSLLEPMGVLSLLTAGYYGKLGRYIDDPDNLRRIIETQSYTNNLGLEARSHTLEQIIALAKARGSKVLDWFGVRIYSDLDTRKIDEVEQAELDQILAVELDMSRNEATRAMGQMVHFVIRKANTSV